MATGSAPLSSAAAGRVVLPHAVMHAGPKGPAVSLRTAAEAARRTTAVLYVWLCCHLDRLGAVCNPAAALACKVQGARCKEQGCAQNRSRGIGLALYFTAKRAPLIAPDAALAQSRGGRSSGQLSPSSANLSSWCRCTLRFIHDAHHQDGCHRENSPVQVSIGGAMLLLRS